MHAPLSNYVAEVDKRFRSGISSEHSYRADLEDLLKKLVPSIEVTNEPLNVTDCGNPDFVVTKSSVPLGFIEAKDVGKDLNSSQFKEQFLRYRKALDNLIITDYLWFLFFQNGELVGEVCIGEVNVDGDKVRPIEENWNEFSARLTEFCSFVSQTIKSPKKLAEMMAGKARLLELIIERAVTSDDESDNDTELKAQFETFKKVLIHDLSPHEFADIYAQTLAYGLFAARLHDKTLDTFSRQEASELIPKTNPFLRKLFGHIAGVDLDDRLRTTVDNLVDVFRATNVEELLNSFNAHSHKNDPIIHFYETFLGEYDPALKKARGVWYTPSPVVQFIVHSVEKVLKSSFAIADGLASTEKVDIEVEAEGTAVTKGKAKGKKLAEKRSVHRVQILDPATGTGTFLGEVIETIYSTYFKSIPGAWSNFVDNDLVPRLHGFELLMASYAMAHLKLDLLLDGTGYIPTKNQRINVFLTNSLEEHHPDTGTLFSAWLSQEANEANRIKRDAPVMVVIGNPPYSSSSSNKGDWIQGLVADYKKDLNEKKVNLDDDYIKFLRYAHYLIVKNDSGVLAFITNNSFLDGITHRNMRDMLLRDFDKLYVLNLHGDVKKLIKKTDENVFDIQQGVAISILVKDGTKKGKYGEFYYKDLFGKRASKYDYLVSNNIETVDWVTPKLNSQYRFFNETSNKNIRGYQKGVPLNELFDNYNSGIQTKNDSLLVQFDQDAIEQVVADMKDLEPEQYQKKYFVKEGAWKLYNAIEDVKANYVFFSRILYRPFDYRFTALTAKSNGLVGRPRYKTTQHFIGKNNLGLICNRQSIGDEFTHIGVSNCVIAHGTFYLGNRGQDYLIPLYTYTDHSDSPSGDMLGEACKANINDDAIERISSELGMKFCPELVGQDDEWTPVDLMDYILAVLYSPSYRMKYAVFLKMDFPRVPWPSNSKKFRSLVKVGGKLRNAILMKDDCIPESPVLFPMGGTNMVDRKIVKADWQELPEQTEYGRIWINDDQYFDHVPTDMWNFYYGGYQPAQRWLKARNGRKLSYDDIRHYQKLVSSLMAIKIAMAELAELKL